MDKFQIGFVPQLQHLNEHQHPNTQNKKNTKTRIKCYAYLSSSSLRTTQFTDKDFFKLFVTN
jgi:hypothetical protein